MKYSPIWLFAAFSYGVLYSPVSYAQQAGQPPLALQRSVANLRRGDLSVLYDLRQQAEQLLPYLALWATDESSYVRYGAISIASAKQSSQSLKILTEIIENDEVNSGYALNSVFDYGADRLKASIEGTEQRNKVVAALVKRFNAGEQDARIPIMISVLASSKDLEQLRDSATKATVEVPFGGSSQLGTIKLQRVLELSFINSAKSAEIKAFKAENSKEKLFELYCIRWISHPSQKAELVTFLNDESYALTVNYSGDNDPSVKRRVCDVAYDAFLFLKGRRNLNFRNSSIYDKATRSSLLKELKQEAQTTIELKP